MKVKMVPHLDSISGESGINTVIREYFEHLPEIGVDLVHPDSKDYDVAHVHAGVTDRYKRGVPIVSSLHGLYWTADYDATQAEWAINARVTNSILAANEVTVPSAWVNETLQRDMHLSAHIIPHGIDWREWDHEHENEGYVLAYAKNRAYFDVSNPNHPTRLARAYPKINFVGTFGETPRPRNYHVTGVVEHHRMKQLVQRAAVFVSPVKETFGIGALEAMAAGVPVLTVDRGQVPQLVGHGHAGYCYQPGDLSDMATGLEYCLEYRDALGANAREEAKKWTWERACKMLAGVYRSAANVQEPTVGVVIPVYNKEIRYVERAIDSVKRQTRRADRIIVVDDGSENGAEIEELCKEKDGVEYIRQTNRGVAHARNRGISELDTKYVVPLDSDDAIAPDFLRMCVDALENDPTVYIAYTKLKWIQGEREGISQWPGEYEFDKFLERKNQVPTCSVYRSEVWERLGGYRQRYAPTGAGAEDAEFYLRAGAHGYRGQLVTNKPLFIYTMGSGHTSKPGYTEVDWLAWHTPWLEGKHPFASRATPKNSISHPVRQYDEPDISVIIPVGPDHEKYLWDALDSLEAQTFHRWEAIVVIDDSRPEITEGIAELQLAYPFARFVRTDPYSYYRHRGPGHCRNLGAGYARAPLLLFLDADDWLHPEFMEEAINVWDETGYGVYTDYVGKAYVNDVNQLASNLRDNVINYDDDKGEATIRFKAKDYDCHKAIQQPAAGLPYIWCNITTLIPREWHDDIGGFDESMSSWEDVDYWWRMARAGRCFYRVSRPLMAYRFYTGTRREDGLRDNQRLLSYLTEKREQDVNMGCGCNKKTNPPTNQPPSGPMAALGEVNDTMNDEDLILVRYTHPNRGQHPVVGHATGRKYHYHAGGEKFLVHRDDVAAAPNLFQPVEEVRARERVSHRQTAPAPPPPPPGSNGEPEPASFDEREQAVDEQTKEEIAGQEALMDILDELNLDKRAVQSLYTSGVTTVQDVIDLGEDGLRELKWIGDSRAHEIHDLATGGGS